MCSSEQKADKEPKTEREEEKKIPQAHYGTNNPSHLRGDGRASWTDSQPVDLWQRPEVRLRGEGPPITHGWKHHKAASDCQEKYHKRKKQLRRERGKERKKSTQKKQRAEQRVICIFWPRFSRSYCAFFSAGVRRR